MCSDVSLGCQQRREDGGCSPHDDFHRNRESVLPKSPSRGGNHKDPSCSSTIQVSVAKCDHVRVLDKSLLESRIGKLTQTAVIAVGLGIAYVFDIR